MRYVNRPPIPATPAERLPFKTTGPRIVMESLELTHSYREELERKEAEREELLEFREACAKGGRAAGQEVEDRETAVRWS